MLSNKNLPNYYFINAQAKLANKKYFDEKIISAFNLYFIMNILDGNTGNFYKYKTFNVSTKRAFDFFKANSAHIEILFEEKIEKIYFPIQPACALLSHNHKFDVMHAVNRESPS